MASMRTYLALLLWLLARCSSSFYIPPATIQRSRLHVIDEKAVSDAVSVNQKPVDLKPKKMQRQSRSTPQQQQPPRRTEYEFSPLPAPVEPEPPKVPIRKRKDAYQERMFKKQGST